MLQSESPTIRSIMLSALSNNDLLDSDIHDRNMGNIAVSRALLDKKYILLEIMHFYGDQSDIIIAGKGTVLQYTYN